MENIEQLEKRLWNSADQMRANSGLGSNEYFLPVMGLIFLRHAYNRFLKVKAKVEPTLAKRGGVSAPLTKEHFNREAALFLRAEARWDVLVNLPEQKDPGKALAFAMESIEKDNSELLSGILPKDYSKLEPEVIRGLLRTFNDSALNTTNGDVFGRIYEYFLMKFAAEKAHDGGEFYTPVSLVQTIVNVIEPDHGIVFDPACGSAGMLVQSSHFMEKVGKKAHKAVTFYGQEKSATTIRFAKMNLAVHGLEGKIIEGNSYYTDAHALGGKADFVMANPPFNVDEIDAEKVKNSGRLPFGLPGVNKKKKTVSNGNYVWISYFYAYLNSKGRAGFVMSSQASSAGHGEKEVRRKIVESGHADVMIAIRSNFFYTRTVPCELWFFDKGKPKERLDRVLLIDARNVYRKVSRKVNDFSPEQLQNLTAIVWLYRGESERYLGLVKEYLTSMGEECGPVAERLAAFEASLEPVKEAVTDFSETLNGAKVDQAAKEAFQETSAEWTAATVEYATGKKSVLKAIRDFLEKHARKIPEKNGAQIKVQESFASVAEKLKKQVKLVEHMAKLAGKVVDAADTIMNGGKNGSNSNGEKKNGNRIEDLDWDSRAVKRMLKELEVVRDEAVAQLRRPVYYHHQAHWLQTRFPDAKLADVEGLVKLVDRKQIKGNDWSLTPGRYVGVAAPYEEDDFDFNKSITEIHAELVELGKEANLLGRRIAQNLEAFLP